MVVSIIVQDEITISLSVFLRKLSIFLFCICLVPFIVEGAVTEEVFPALGLLGLAGSALIAVIDLRGRRVKLPPSDSGRCAPRKYLVLLVDLGLFAFHLAFIIVSIILLSQRGYRWRRPSAVMGTYNTVALWINLVVHFYFILRAIARNKEHDEVAAIIEEGRSAHPRFQPYTDDRESVNENTGLIGGSAENTAEASIDASKN